MITEALRLVNRSLAKVFVWKPGVGEFFTCWGGIGYITVAACSHDESVSKSVQYLSGFGRSTDFWYTLAAIGFVSQLSGLVFNWKWVRWFGAVMVAAWWLTLSQALLSSQGLVPLVPVYAALAGLNCYIFGHLLWEE